MSDRFDFALCLTHDVDRPFKTYQGLFYGLRLRSLYHLRTTLPDRNPYWQFEDIMALEDDLGVRSAFYFLSEPSLFARDPKEWFSVVNWIEHLGRYNVREERLATTIHRLDESGWEVGIHGSRETARDRTRLAAEKARLETVLGHSISGGRQHHLLLDRPDTWRHQAAVGLKYDTTLGSATEYGFQHGYRPLHPFDDEFVVYPLTLMEIALPDPATAYAAAWDACERLLDEAAENGAVMTVLWHPRFFNETEFPGYRRLYRRLVERALELDAWVGPPEDLYARTVGGEPAAIRRHDYP